MLIPKDEREKRIFSEFCAAAQLQVDSGSIASGTPPQPDVLFAVSGRPRWAELVEKGKTYGIGGSPLELVAYYDKQHPATSVQPRLIPETVGPIAAEMIASGVWQRIWVYDTWHKEVLWVYPPR